jgi:hypothetical protein
MAETERDALFQVLDALEGAAEGRRWWLRRQTQTLA